MNIFLAGYSYLEPQCAFTHVSLSSGSFLFSSALHASFLPGYSAKLKREREMGGGLADIHNSDFFVKLSGAEISWKQGRL